MNKACLLDSAKGQLSQVSLRIQDRLEPSL